MTGVQTCALPISAAGAVPDFSSGGIGWLNTHNDFIRPAAGPGPVTWDPAHPYFGNGDGPKPTSRVADLTNPILMPWVKDALQKFNADALAGKPQYTPIARCWPSGVPGNILLRVNPMFIVQTPSEVLFLYQSDHQVRHVYMNRPHAKTVAPSWYGESIGHYEGDTLVDDTVGIDERAPVDGFGTPHTKQLHVVERFHLIENGAVLEANVRVEDPGAFTTPWNAVQLYRQYEAAVRQVPIDRLAQLASGEEGPLIERTCAENPSSFFAGEEVLPIPQAAQPDF